jgi:hypothetical protein
MTRDEADRKLRDRWETLTFEGLSIREKEAVALLWLDGDVFNGGIHQYFFNSSGDLAPFALSAMSRLGAHAQERLLRSAIAKLGVDPRELQSRDARQERLDRLGWETDPFDEETMAWYVLNQSMYSLALAELADAYPQ